MRLTFRLKLILLIVSALLTLSAVIGLSDIIEATSASRLRDIEARLLPRMEVGPRLEAEFTRLGREFQDAAAAQDPSALAATLDTRNRILELIASAGSAIEPSLAARLRWSIQDYYESAHAVTAQLIRGDTGVHQLQQMGEMQRRLRTAEEVMQRTIEVDQTEVAVAFAAARHSGATATNYRRGIGLVGVIFLLALGYWASRQMLTSISALSSGLGRFSTGDFSMPVEVETDDELADVAREANAMARSLEELAESRDRDDWVRRAHVDVADQLRGNLTPNLVGERALRFLVERSGAVAGALYLVQDDGRLVLVGSYARGDPGGRAGPGETTDGAARPVRQSFAAGEGLLGQAFLAPDLTVLKDLPPGYFKLVSGLGEAEPRALAFLPLSRPDKTIGVIELALLDDLSPAARELLESIRTTLAVTFEAAAARAALEEVLLETQRQAERLSAQEEELRQNNRELATQQEELRGANDELEAQRKALSHRNWELDQARQRTMEKAEELGRVSLYKSQFLANMSHELRTPLNSMLLLSHLLAENAEQNLTVKQVEYASTIHSAGEDLLQLINQVLDLSKIEAGKQDVTLAAVPITELTERLGRIFSPLAAEKGLSLQIVVQAGTPSFIRTDPSRVERILTNLLGNAIKFTEQGTVTLDVHALEPGVATGRVSLLPHRSLAFAVSDTGIGIAQSERERIFVPFEQLEASSARRYQGTGLGLSIARESAILLGGELTVDSVQGRGSTFTLILPLEEARQEPTPGVARKQVEDDRVGLTRDDPHILLIEDDALLAEQIRDIAHARGLKVLIARTGTEGLALAKSHGPRGIVLDIKLPDIDGWTVLERLRTAPDTRGIPVHFLSALEAPKSGLSHGAIGYLTKPATRSDLIELVLRLTAGGEAKEQRILVVEDHPAEGRSLVMALEAEHFHATLVPTAAEALRVVRDQKFSCIVLDLGLPDMDGLALLAALREREDLTGAGIVIHTGRSLTKKEARELEAHAQAIVVKDQCSLARLLEEIRLFVHHVEVRTPRKPEGSRPDAEERILEGLRILIVEDDMRTAYSLLALLQSRGCQVVVAENGKEALALLAVDPAVDCVLMDIMMPEMDGYEAMRMLRRQAAFATLPIIALTAKAMPGERERCLAAGASDYLSKPVEGGKLLATLHHHAKEAQKRP